eukprot:3131339-Rhodomonas_salina.1
MSWYLLRRTACAGTLRQYNCAGTSTVQRRGTRSGVEVYQELKLGLTSSKVTTEYSRYASTCWRGGPGE